MSDNNRDVRTLLLSKVHSDHCRAYEEICAISKDKPDRRSFFTVGGFDALSIYKLSTLSSPDWMEKLAEDKKEVLREMSRNVSYHPVHIVANLSNGTNRCERINSFWSEKTLKQYPFLLVTLVYGAYHSSEEPYEDALWDYLSRFDNDKSCRYVVYNSVNLCDLVVLWYTNDISTTLNNALSISQATARKTYTFVNIPLVGNAFESTIETNMNKQEGPFSICVRGSIRSKEEFNRVIKYPLLDSPHPYLPKSKCYMSYGENDFMLTADVTGNQFWRLLNYFLSKSDKVDSACWNIYTEFQQSPSKDLEKICDGATRAISQENPPHDILSNEYSRYLEVYKTLDFPWADAFMELTSIHAHMDKLPVLHGPSYLVWGCLNVANKYLEGEIPGYSAKDGSLRSLLKRSQYSIDRFVRAWSQLTDQITKVDDVIFHRLGSTAAIYSTLSESILELYHLFLSQFSAALIRSDNKKEPDRVYSFLLVPMLNQQMRISKMFKVEAAAQSDQQVYIIEFPLSYIYKPGQFVVQLAHECMHIFGDTMRERQKRLEYMQGYLCFELINNFTSVLDQRNLSSVVFRKLNKEMSQYVPEGAPLYLNSAVKALKACFKEKILTQETYGQLCSAAKTQEEQSIFNSSNINNWIRLIENFERKEYENPTGIIFADTIEACADFFKECYADAMVIKLLGISSFDYLKAFVSEAALNPSEDSIEGVNFIQRIAIVITACLEENIFQSGEEGVKCISAELKKLYSFESMDFSGRIENCIRALYSDNSIQKPHFTRWPPNKNIHYISRNALISVVDYLRETLRSVTVGKGSIQLTMRKKTDSFSEVRDLYKSVILNGRFFDAVYYKRILEYHNDIATKAKNSR